MSIFIINQNLMSNSEIVEEILFCVHQNKIINEFQNKIKELEKSHPTFHFFDLAQMAYFLLEKEKVVIINQQQ